MGHTMEGTETGKIEGIFFINGILSAIIMILGAGIIGTHYRINPDTYRPEIGCLFAICLMIPMLILGQAVLYDGINE